MLRVHALSCGSLEFDRNLFFPAEAPGTKITTPVSSWLVVHPQGKLVFDTGISCEALPDPAGRLGKRVASLFAIRSRAGEDVARHTFDIGFGEGHRGRSCWEKPTGVSCRPAGRAGCGGAS